MAAKDAPVAISAGPMPPIQALAATAIRKNTAGAVAVDGQSSPVRMAAAPTIKIATTYCIAGDRIEVVIKACPEWQSITHDRIESARFPHLLMTFSRSPWPHGRDRLYSLIDTTEFVPPPLPP